MGKRVLVIGLVVVAFAAGWLVAKVQDVNRRDFNEVLANRWVANVSLLVDNVVDLKRVDPRVTQSILRAGLDTDSAILAQRYDGMSPDLRKRVAFYLPAAREIAVGQEKSTSPRHGRDLLAFIDCVRQAQTQHGSSVRVCFNDRRKRTPAVAGAESVVAHAVTSAAR